MYPSQSISFSPFLSPSLQLPYSVPPAQIIFHYTFWCFYGAGIESFSKLGDSIYVEEVGKVAGLCITQYISRSLNWKSGQISPNQKVEPVVASNPLLQVALTMSSEAQYILVLCSFKEQLQQHVRVHAVEHFLDHHFTTTLQNNQSSSLSVFSLSLSYKYNTACDLEASLSTERAELDAHLQHLHQNLAKLIISWISRSIAAKSTLHKLNLTTMSPYQWDSEDAERGFASACNGIEPS
ncbi:Homeobox protein knotted-1-like 7 [Camellia lanceoleosa]|nr:Homeobox protein knotted-1-like 7 [Camellia lanceoleosa]